MKTVLVFFALLAAVPASSAVSCGDALSSTRLQKLVAVLRKESARNPNADFSIAFGLYDQAARMDPMLNAILSRESVFAMLLDPDYDYFARRLRFIFETMIQNQDTFARSIEYTLEHYVPRATIGRRVRGVKKGMSLAQLQQALGEVTLEQMQQVLHGGSPLEPKPDSLLGRYLAETGAATVVRRFPTGPRGTPGLRLGPKKLVVAVSEESFAAFLKYFTRPEFLVHLHTPAQGTLMLAHNGKAGSYGDLSDDLRLPKLGTLLPHVLLQTSEARRVARFFELAKVNQSAALEPWNNSPYCATGGYDSCTHWFGNIPLGDRRVHSYQFPGRVDEHASNSVSEDPSLDAKPRVSRLREYKNPEELVHRVWQVPGHEQLAGVLDQMPANLSGEFANPGWVAHVLTGKVSIDRVPVVFYVVSNHRRKFSENFKLQIQAY